MFSTYNRSGAQGTPNGDYTVPHVPDALLKWFGPPTHALLAFLAADTDHKKGETWRVQLETKELKKPSIVVWLEDLVANELHNERKWIALERRTVDSWKRARERREGGATGCGIH